MYVGHRYRSIVLALAVLAASAGSVMGADDNVAAQLKQMQQRLNNQEAELRQLRAAGSDSWLNERRTEEVRTLIREVLSDADTRASLAEGGMTAGHNGKKFFLASEDGSFLMNIEGQIQFRWIWNNVDGDSDDNESGFVIRRTKLKFSGHIADPKFGYEVQIEVARDDNDVVGDVILIDYDLTDTLNIAVGEGKAPFLREEFTSSKRQLAVERSLVNELFTADVVQGIFLTWDAHEAVKVRGSVNDGAKSGDGSGGNGVEVIKELFVDNDSDFDGGAGVDFTDPDSKEWDDDGTDFALTGRIDILLAGDWKQYKDFTSWPGEEMFAYIGGAVHYEVGETGDSLENDKYLMWTVDGGVEYKGFSLFASFVMLHTDFESEASDVEDYDMWGLVVQGGYNIDLGNGDSIEPFVRWEHFDSDGAIDDVAVVTGGTSDDYENELDIITFGVNWYHKKHNAKFTADFVYALDGIAPGLGQSGGGTRSDDPDKDGQMVLRLQYQLLF